MEKSSILITSTAGARNGINLSQCDNEKFAPIKHFLISITWRAANWFLIVVAGEHHRWCLRAFIFSDLALLIQFLELFNLDLIRPCRKPTVNPIKPHNSLNVLVIVRGKAFTLVDLDKWQNTPKSRAAFITHHHLTRTRSSLSQDKDENETRSERHQLEPSITNSNRVGSAKCHIDHQKLQKRDNNKRRHTESIKLIGVVISASLLTHFRLKWSIS